jgi:hypothetical protein
MDLGEWLYAWLHGHRHRSPSGQIVVWFWSGAWQRGERAALHDLQQGQYQDFSSVNDLLAALSNDVGADETARAITAGLRTKRRGLR